MKTDEYGHIRWDKSDFKKHGTIAKYLIGKCRCKKCKTRFFDVEHDEQVIHAMGQARRRLYSGS